MAYEYKMGTTQGGMVLLSVLGIPAPKHGFVPYSVEVDLGDGGQNGHGWPTDEWYWAFLTASQRATLKTLVPGKSATIYIRDLKDDGVTWKDFQVKAIWPKVEDRQSGRRMGFALQFRAMVELP